MVAGGLSCQMGPSIRPKIAEDCANHSFSVPPHNLPQYAPPVWHARVNELTTFSGMLSPAGVILGVPAYPRFEAYGERVRRFRRPLLHFPPACQDPEGDDDVVIFPSDAAEFSSPCSWGYGWAGQRAKPEGRSE